MALTQAQVALVLGITARRLRQMHQEGEAPPQNAQGQYEEAEFGMWLQRKLAPQTGAYVYEEERARLTHEQADKTALEVAELRADLVRMSVVEAHWSQMGAALRAKLVSIPSKVGALVADPVQRVKFVGQSEALIYDALAEIQQDAIPASIRARATRARDGDVPVVAPAATEADAEPVGGRPPDAVAGGRKRARKVPKQ
jgi:hypothetical protein